MSATAYLLVDGHGTRVHHALPSGGVYTAWVGRCTPTLFAVRSACIEFWPGVFEPYCAWYGQSLQWTHVSGYHIETALLCDMHGRLVAARREPQLAGLDTAMMVG